jgi:hypothetical protein
MANLYDLWRVIETLPHHEAKELAQYVYDPFERAFSLSAGLRGLAKLIDDLPEWERAELAARFGEHHPRPLRISARDPSRSYLVEVTRKPNGRARRTALPPLMKK